MGKALVNTVAGMGTVFVILIIIMIVIFAFNLIPVIQAKFSKEAKVQKPAAAAASAPATVAAAADEIPVAVITAAIAAYEESIGGMEGGFVVRSIKRRF